MAKKTHYPLTRDDVKVLSEQIVYQGFYEIKKYQLQHRLFQGGWSQPVQREVFNCNRVAAVIPYDPKLDKVIFIEQFRAGALSEKNPWLIEIVAGIVDHNETLEEMIKRELHEEAGLNSTDLLKIYEYWVSPGGSAEHLTLYCAKVDASQAGGVFGLAEESEDILVHVMDSNEAFQKLASGEINNSATIIALQWLQIHKKSVQDKWLHNL